MSRFNLRNIKLFGKRRLFFNKRINSLKSHATKIQQAKTVKKTPISIQQP